jgi:hypothetical protein
MASAAMRAQLDALMGIGRNGDVVRSLLAPLLKPLLLARTSLRFRLP